jgi:hypothetical protein
MLAFMHAFKSAITRDTARFPPIDEIEQENDALSSGCVPLCSLHSLPSVTSGSFLAYFTDT